MKYIIWVLLSVAFATLYGTTPAHINKQTHGTVSAQAATAAVKATPDTPKSQPEKQTATVIMAATPEQPKPEGCAYYKSLIAQYDWNANVMYGVMRAESGCNPNAVNTHNYDGVYDYGLLQLHGQAIYEPVNNIAAAYRLWRVQGYRAWTTYNTGAYLRYL